MKLITILLLLSPLTTFGATEELLDKQFAVQPGGSLIVDVDFGSINISTNATDEVTVNVWRKIGRRKKADEEKFLRENPVILSQDNNTITIRSRQKSGTLQNWFSGKNRNEAKYTITVPAQFNAGLKTAGGGISVKDLSGKVSAGTSGGDLAFARLRGPLDGDTSGGGIGVADCNGTLKIHTSGGDINVTGGSGTLQGDTSGGPIIVKDFQGPARVETSGGGITIERVTGAIEGSTSGGAINAVIPAPLSGEIKLSTSGGGITARLPTDAAFEIDAETSGGGVGSEFPITVVGKMEHDRLSGTVNGGGKLVRLRTSGGEIRIERIPN